MQNAERGSAMQDVSAQAAYYSIVWFLGFAAAFARTLRDRDYVNFLHCVSSGAFAGFLSFGVVSIWFSRVDFGDVPCLGIACLVGLAGKDIHEQLLNRLIKLTSRKDDP